MDDYDGLSERPDWMLLLTMIAIVAFAIGVAVGVVLAY